MKVKNISCQVLHEIGDESTCEFGQLSNMWETFPIITPTFEMFS